MESAPQQSFARPIRSREGTETATLTTFRMNTCKSVSKQRTLTTFRMNTYEKQGEGGYPRMPRYPFIATAEVVDQSSQASIATRVTVRSLTGCYLEMPNPLPKDAQIK